MTPTKFVGVISIWDYKFFLLWSGFLLTPSGFSWYKESRSPLKEAEVEYNNQL